MTLPPIAVNQSAPIDTWMQPCALLDDSDSVPAQPTCRLYTKFSHMHGCANQLRTKYDSAPHVQDLDRILDAVEQDMRAGLFALVLCDYEWGAAQQVARQMHPTAVSQRSPGLRVLMFRQMALLSRGAADEWLAAMDPDGESAGILHVRRSIDRAQFDAAMDRIHRALNDGECYQVNYTYRIDFDTFGSPVALYRRLRKRQPVRYGAFIALPEFDAIDGTTVGITHILSCSPELFLRNKDGQLTARPMKGTAASHAPLAHDESFDSSGRAARSCLQNDPKSCAENVMIVDLMRNDLSRVAQVGSVRVPALFSIERHAALLQMTSTVEATLPPDVSLADVARAVFPCGSITGAPKHRVMEIISEIESTPRGLYTGAIGWIEAPALIAPRRACGDFCFSVAIRTVTLDASFNPVRGRMGVGAGIVVDSRAEDEYEECLLKARFLTDLDPGFSLFETMYATREAGIRHLDRHLSRLEQSSASLGFVWNRSKLLNALSSQAKKLGSKRIWRLRLDLKKSGQIEISVAPVVPLDHEPVTLLLAKEPQGDAALARYKTSHRAHFDRALREAEHRGAFDQLFYNVEGFLTQGARTNAFLRIDGRWWTPPIEQGILPGIMRGILLDHPVWQAAERTLTLEDLRRAEAVVVCNALRGPLLARVIR